MKEMFKIENGVLFDVLDRNIETVVIPDGVTSIGDNAFWNCTSLSSVTIPSSVTNIGESAFSYCTNLASIIIPNSIIWIGNGAFEGCKSLKSKKSNYKAFDLINEAIVCRNYQFIPNEWSKEELNIKAHLRGYHFCTNLFEVFNYYYGEIDTEIVLYECEIGDKIIRTDTSKICTNKIKPVKRLYREDVIKLLNV